jgi:endo-1,3-1,4-beta-glycanase ExoK
VTKLQARTIFDKIGAPEAIQLRQQSRILPKAPLMKNVLKISTFLAAVLGPQLCWAVGSSELYTSKAYGYGRIETRIRFAAGDGVVSSFFMWKDGSEKAGTFWNELDFEKVGADCHVQTNPIYGNPSANHGKHHALQADLCGAYHTYTYEWTPEAIVWLLDGAEIRRETGATALAFSENASAGMQIHFNVWPGDATFGGNFSPSILPVHQYIDWVQFSSYKDGAFTLAWREDFNAATVPEGWLTGSWASPKNLSTHAPENVNFINGYAVLSLTADNALGPAGAMVPAQGGAGSMNGAAGASGAQASGGSSSVAGAPGGGRPGTAGSGGSPGTPNSGGTPGSAGAPGSGGTPGTPNAGGTPGTPNAGGTPSAAGAPGAASSASAGAVALGGAMNGSSPAATDSGGCSVGRSSGSNALWWAIGISAIASRLRRARRIRG